MYEDAKWRTRQLLYLSEQVACPGSVYFLSGVRNMPILTLPCFDVLTLQPVSLRLSCSMQTSGEEPNKLTIMMADVVKVSASSGGAHSALVVTFEHRCCAQLAMPQDKSTRNGQRCAASHGRGGGHPAVRRGQEQQTHKAVPDDLPPWRGVTTCEASVGPNTGVQSAKVAVTVKMYISTPYYLLNDAQSAAAHAQLLSFYELR